MRTRSFRRALRKSPASKWPARAGWLVVSVLVLSVVVVVVRNLRRHDALTQWRNELETTSGRPAWPMWAPDWPALPAPRSSRRQLPTDLRGPYAFAARERQLVGQIPCYCGCVKQGHRSNLSCFVNDFRADGTPLWTDHAFSCPMCVHIAREVMLMSAKGMSGEEIRSAIDAQYSEVGRPTDTPMVGRKAAHH